MKNEATMETAFSKYKNVNTCQMHKKNKGGGGGGAGEGDQTDEVLI